MIDAEDGKKVRQETESERVFDAAVVDLAHRSVGAWVESLVQIVNGNPLLNRKP